MNTGIVFCSSIVWEPHVGVSALSQCHMYVNHMEADRVSQSLSQRMAYITADCWIKSTVMSLSFTVYSLVSALSQRDGRGRVHWSNCWALVWVWPAIKKGLLVSIPMKMFYSLVIIFLKSIDPLNMLRNMNNKCFYSDNYFHGLATNWMTLEMKAL